jgi:hypothetical protein
VEGPPDHGFAWHRAAYQFAMFEGAPVAGEVLLPPTPAPGRDHAAVLRDPQGAGFGVFAPEGA